MIHDAQTYPGVVLRCRPVGILEVEQESQGKKERNDRVFAVPDRSPLETDLQDIRHLPARAREELEQFFRATNALEDKKLEFLGWRGPTRAAKSGCLGRIGSRRSREGRDVKGQYANGSHAPPRVRAANRAARRQPYRAKAYARAS